VLTELTNHSNAERVKVDKAERLPYLDTTRSPGSEDTSSGSKHRRVSNDAVMSHRDPEGSAQGLSYSDLSERAALLESLLEATNPNELSLSNSISNLTPPPSFWLTLARLVLA
jgi:hypothetical protein